MSMSLAFRPVPEGKIAIGNWATAQVFLVEDSDLARKNLHVIHCSLCSEPAVEIDGYWPWMTDFCRCKEHRHGGLEHASAV